MQKQTNLLKSFKLNSFNRFISFNLLIQCGSVIANYSYDALGKKLSIKNAAGNDITDQNNIALLNPLRYCGYVYDDETGLFYLQSRYYDPTVGRFINADCYYDTSSGTPLSTNMFAYCENNPISKSDPTGQDAWWLQDTVNVATMGHTSLLIQESPGNWWYFYWGDDSIQLVYIGTCTLLSLNYYLIKNNLYKSWWNPYFNTGYNAIIHFKGNFRNCLNYIFTLMGYRSNFFSRRGKRYKVSPNRSYNLIYRNCMQMSCAVLLKGFFYYYDMAYKISLATVAKFAIPNIAYRLMHTFDTNIKLKMLPSLALSHLTSYYRIFRNYGVNIYKW